MTGSVWIWDTLTAAVDELDVIRAQVREGRTQERTARFYQLLSRNSDSQDRTDEATVIEMAEGWCVVHWTHDPKSVAMYSSIESLRRALLGNGALILSLVDSSARRPQKRQQGTAARGYSLSETERRVAIGLGHGMTNKELMVHVGLAESTVKNNLSRVYEKLGVGGRQQAALLVRDLGLEEDAEPL